MTAAKDKRLSKNWSVWLGKVGTVVATTMVRVSPPAQTAFVPYSYLIVDFDGHKKEMMGAGHDSFEVGDKIKCVLRKIALKDKKGIIEYGLKAKKI